MKPLTEDSIKEEQPQIEPPFIRRLDGKEILDECKREQLPIYFAHVSNNRCLGKERRTVLEFGPDSDRVKFLRVYWEKEPSSKQVARLRELLGDWVGVPPHMKYEEIQGCFRAEVKHIPAPLASSFSKQFNYSQLEQVLQMLPRDLEAPPIWGDLTKEMAPLVEGLASDLLAQPATGELDGVCCFSTALSAPKLSVMILARWLIKVALDKEPAQAICYLRSFVESDTIETIEALYLNGFNVCEEIELPHNILLAPVPPEDDDIRNTKIIEHPSHLPYPEISAVLITEECLPKFASPNRPETPTSVYKTRALLSKIADILVLANAGPAVKVSAKSIPPEWHPFNLVGNLPKEVEALSGAFHSQYFPADPSTVKKIVKKYLDAPEDVQDKLGVAVKRLNFALRRRDETETAIDIGIALEALLANDREARKTPISHLVRVRGAILLGGSKEEREANKKFLNDLYELRSQAAHSGKIDNRPKFKDRPKLSASAFLDEGVHLCRRMIFQILDRGGFPDWASIELGIDDARAEPEN